MARIMNLQNLQQENGALLMTKIMDNMAEEMKMIQLLNLRQVIKPNLCDYTDTYILVTGDIKVAAVTADTNVAFKNCAPLTRCVTHISNEHVQTAETLDMIMPIHNLIEYSDSYAD